MRINWEVLLSDVSCSSVTVKDVFEQLLNARTPHSSHDTSQHANLVHILKFKVFASQIHVKLAPHGEFEGVESVSLWSMAHKNGFKIPAQVRKQLPFPDLVVVRPAPLDVPLATFLDIIENGSFVRTLTIRTVDANCAC